MVSERRIGVIFNEIFTRLPDIEAAEPPDVLEANFIHGIKHLRATFTPTGPAS